MPCKTEEREDETYRRLPVDPVRHGVLILFAMGCASNPAKMSEVAQQESQRLAKPSRALSSFGRFELNTMQLAEAVTAEEDKIAIARQLEEKLQARLQPLFDEWQAAGSAKAHSGTLVIQPKVQQLRVVSGGARFWAGAMAGDSFIDMDMDLIDAESKTSIGKPRIYKSASAMGGGWSVGATDRNLLNYMVEITYQYLVDNY
jgi:hypothetical protein